MTRNGNQEENLLYILLISRAGRDNWIEEAIVSQAIHEAKRYTQHHDSICKSYTGSTDCTYCKMY